MNGQIQPVGSFFHQHRRILLNVFKYVLAFGLLAYVIWSNWEPASGHGLKYAWQERVLKGHIHYDYLLLAAGIATVSILLTFFRWYLLVRAVDLPFTLANAMRLGMVGYFFNTFLPGSVGGDIVKAAFIARSQSRRAVAVATVIMDRAIALWALVWLVAISGLIFWWVGLLPDIPSAEGVVQPRLIVKVAGIIVAVTLLVWLALGYLPPHRAEVFAGRLNRIPRAGHALAELWRAAWIYRCRSRTVIAVMLISWVAQVGFVFFFYCCARTLADVGNIPSLPEHFLIVPMGLVVRAIPLFPGGAGISEYAFGGLYKMLKKTSSDGVLAALVQRVIEWTLGLVGYIVYLRTRPALRAAETETEEQSAYMQTEKPAASARDGEALASAAGS